MNKRKDKDYVTASTFPFLPKNIFFWNKAILKDKLTSAILSIKIIISSPVSEKREKRGSMLSQWGLRVTSSHPKFVQFLSSTESALSLKKKKKKSIMSLTVNHLAFVFH